MRHRRAARPPWASRCRCPCPGRRASSRPNRSRRRALARAAGRASVLPDAVGPTSASRGGRLAASTRAVQRGRGGGLADDARPSGGAGRSPRCAPSTNVPGSRASGTCTMRFVRVRRLRRAALAVATLDEHLDRRAHLRRRLLGRDALLQRDEPVEALLHDRLRDLLVEARGAGAGAGRVLERVGAVEPASSTTSSVWAKSSSVSPGKPDDDVGRHRDVGDRRADPLEPPEVALAPVGPLHRAAAPRRSPTAAGSGCARRRPASRPSPRSRPA